jgi:glutamate 5-kinase
LKRLLKDYKRIVIKIGSSLFCQGRGEIETSMIKEVISQISDLVDAGKEVVIVSSGAVALGMSILKLEKRPKELSSLQAVAAIGQHELMDVYRKFFKARKLNCAQILLTWDDFSDRRRYLNAKNTLFTLFRLKSVAVINENDTVSVDEIKFGDNDRLSALVATLINADLLIILSDIDGLLGEDKKTVVRLVDKITPQIKSLAYPTAKKSCVGGMLAKIEAAGVAVNSGIPCLIANGREKDIILSSVENPHGRGTLFLPREDSLASKERWLAFGAKPKGRIIVDEGAKKALLDKKSLLCVGVIGVSGSFSRRDIVSVIDAQKNEFARGKAEISSDELNKAKGSRFAKEAIHRDNIAIL